ncbi:hypothetical protein ONZ45_g3102 [Pleurotus djamor]|nr:hypothetical protein ONZ45_g3102 [Pleurotus djamor]
MEHFSSPTMSRKNANKENPPLPTSLIPFAKDFDAKIDASLAESRRWCEQRNNACGATRNVPNERRSQMDEAQVMDLGHIRLSAVEGGRAIRAIPLEQPELSSREMARARYVGASILFPRLKEISLSLSDSTNLEALDLLSHIETPSLSQLTIYWPHSQQDLEKLDDVYSFFVASVRATPYKLRWSGNSYQLPPVWHHSMTLSTSEGAKLSIYGVQLRQGDFVPFRNMQNIRTLEVVSSELLSILEQTGNESPIPYPSLMQVDIPIDVFSPKTRILPIVKRWIKSRAAIGGVQQLRILGSNRQLDEKDIRPFRKMLSTESDEGSEVDYNDLPTIIPLLPVPPNLVLPKDKLCKVCKGLGLSAEQFVVDRSESEACNSTLIKKELVTDMLKKSYCPLCRLIITALGGSKLPTVEDGASVWVTLESYTNDGSISSPDGDDLLQIRGLYPYAYKLKGKSLSARGQLPTLPEITLLANDSPVLSARLVRPIQQDKIDFNLVRNWIQICEVDHRKDCDKGMMEEHQQDHPADVIPDFRLIDVVDNCLVRGADIHGVKYATLSYVWGRVEFLRTLKSNVGHFEQHGGLWRPEVYEKIPLTIRDAMQVTKEIGLRYLWVDSLCIVQDDDSGKKEEAIKRMDLVYGASFITILAVN